MSLTTVERRVALGELDHPTIVDFPLRGEWTVERTPAHRIPSHGTDILGQRYAYDFIRTDDRAGSHVHSAGRLRWLLIGGRTQECYGWGEPVHAATDGEVVVAVDGVQERQLGARRAGSRGPHSRPSATTDDRTTPYSSPATTS